MVLPENIDDTYPERRPGDRLHQQHHDEIHARVNALVSEVIPQVDSLTQEVTVGRLSSDGLSATIAAKVSTDAPNNATPIGGAFETAVRDRAIVFGGAPSTVASLPPLPQRQIVTSFQSGHGWSASGGSDVNNTDPAAQVMGPQAIKIVTPGTGSGRSAFRFTGLNLDMTGKQFSILVTVVNPTKVTEISLSAGDGTNIANRGIFYAQGSISGADEYTQAGEPVWIDLPWYVTSSSGTGLTRSNIAGAQITVNDDGTGPVTMYVHALAITPIPAPWSTTGTGCLGFSLDDGAASHYTAALPALGRAGFAANVWPICDSIDVAGKMTTAQLIAAQDVFGCHVGAHAYTTASHTAGYGSMTSADRLIDMERNRKWLEQRGLKGHEFLAYPQGQFRGGVLADARSRFVAARTTNSRTMNVLPLRQPDRIRAFTVLASTPLATVTAMMDRAKAANAHVELVFHQLVTASPTGFEWTVADFESAVSYAASIGIPVKTLPQVLAAR
jgi:hypothetical protein